MRAAQRCAGFTYVGLLFLTAVMGLGLAAVGWVWHTASVRDKEAELMFAGDQFRKAIVSYRTQAPGGTREWPKTLDDLLLDPRWPEVRRHLRKIYVDPFTGKPEWGLIMHGDRIVGVHSLSDSLPLRTAGFPKEYEQFALAKAHADWEFIDTEGAAAAAQARVAAAGRMPGQPLAPEGDEPTGVPATVPPLRARRN